MNTLYKKSEIWFAVTWIIAYVVGTSAADALSEALGVAKSVTLLWLIVLTAISLIWMKKNALFKVYGLCASPYPAHKFLFYLPLVAMASVNVWCGVQLNMPLLETALYVGSMLLVGFLEELIFRGFLFKAMQKDSLRAAVIVSSLTFGIGHIVNLINGSGADLAANLCQVCYAAAGGFMFVILFYKGKSLLPCIAAHSAINMLSAFSNETAMASIRILTALFLCAVSLLYAFWLYKALPAPKEDGFD